MKKKPKVSVEITEDLCTITVFNGKKTIKRSMRRAKEHEQCSWIGTRKGDWDDDLPEHMDDLFYALESIGSHAHEVADSLKYADFYDY